MSVVQPTNSEYKPFSVTTDYANSIGDKKTLAIISLIVSPIIFALTVLLDIFLAGVHCLCGSKAAVVNPAPTQTLTNTQSVAISILPTTTDEQSAIVPSTVTVEDENTTMPARTASPVLFGHLANLTEETVVSETLPPTQVEETQVPSSVETSSSETVPSTVAALPEEEAQAPTSVETSGSETVPSTVAPLPEEETQAPASVETSSPETVPSTVAALPEEETQEEEKAQAPRSNASTPADLSVLFGDDLLGDILHASSVLVSTDTSIIPDDATTQPQAPTDLTIDIASSTGTPSSEEQDVSPVSSSSSRGSTPTETIAIEKNGIRAILQLGPLSTTSRQDALVSIGTISIDGKFSPVYARPQTSERHTLSFYRIDGSRELFVPKDRINFN